jgi:hypothetical protein
MSAGVARQDRVVALDTTRTPERKLRGSTKFTKNSGCPGGGSRAVNERLIQQIRHAGDFFDAGKNIIAAVHLST